MRVVFIGVSHWHTPLYLDPALELPEVAVVGASDPDLARAAASAGRARCPAFADYRAMCEQVRPDFAFAFGRHCDMPEIARFLIDARIPFAMEKPCGTSAAEVTDLAARARRADAFAAVGFVMRLSPILDAMRGAAPGEKALYLSFKFIAGLAERYRAAGVDWMLRRATAGGGAMLNLGVHFFDLCRLLLDEEPVVVGATMGNALAGLDIEDHGLVLLRAGAAQCCIETGYAYPAPVGVFDMHFSIRTSRHFFAASRDDALEIVDDARRRDVRAVPTTNMACYPLFVRDVVRRVERGEKPLADLDDMAAAMRLVEAAYAMAPLPAA